jgi:hypothetical protein
MSVSSASANVLANPGFEDTDASGGDVPGAAGWGGWEFNYTTATQAYSGNQSMKLYGPWYNWGTSGVVQEFAAAPGETWVGEVESLVSSSDPMTSGNFAVMKIEFYNGSGGAAGDVNNGEWWAGYNVFEVVIANESSVQDEWQFYGLGTAPAPPETALVKFLLIHVQADPVGGGSVFVDDANFFVPEPVSMLLLGLGGLAIVRRRR